jgi:uncharacterized protein YecT (DUF1311 family)
MPAATVLLGLILCACACAQTQAEMNRQACDGWKSADARLNAAYKKLLAAKPRSTSAIRSAQRAWVSFRDAEVAAWYPRASASGSAAPVCRCGLLQRLTETRVQDLKRQLAPAEGDVCAPR